MFTGIIETLGEVVNLRHDGTNLHICISSSLSHELKIDQSVSHDGVCLTVVDLGENTHTVTAIEETLRRSTLSCWQKGRLVNLERAMQAGSRFDGHIVQGHVDTIGTCVAVEDRQGSWLLTIEYPFAEERLLVDKGSICVDGVSLTVVEPEVAGNTGRFRVAIIPYTWQHTNLRRLSPGDKVNLEFDILGKYAARYLRHYAQR
ncbi:MAG: riboflavin synthase subunit alpha [Saprospiraceae bacterium]|nr:MAG: riboflavin synthase subunit alpha [Saprospiraceae bacterium]